MNIEPRKIKIRDVFQNYADNGETVSLHMVEDLPSWPAYQREFVYNLEQARSCNPDCPEGVSSQCNVLGSRPVRIAMKYWMVNSVPSL